jgi:hypothetical protein
VKKNNTLIFVHSFFALKSTSIIGEMNNQIIEVKAIQVNNKVIIIIKKTEAMKNRKLLPGEEEG